MAEDGVERPVQGQDRSQEAGKRLGRGKDDWKLGEGKEPVIEGRGNVSMWSVITGQPSRGTGISDQAEVQSARKPSDARYEVEARYALVCLL